MLGSIFREKLKKALTVSALLALIGCGAPAEDSDILSAAKAGYETFQTETWRRAKTQAVDVTVPGFHCGRLRAPGYQSRF